jgi:hypothetical protein
MHRTMLITVFIGVLASALVIGGQTVNRDSPPSVPDGDGAWTIRITTDGGFTGRGRGNVTLTSQGELTCLQTQRPCINKLIDDSCAQSPNWFPLSIPQSGSARHGRRTWSATTATRPP